MTGFGGLSAYASTKGALEALAKCLNIEEADAGVTFHILHPPLTRTASSSPLPVPPEFMADPEKVGRGWPGTFLITGYDLPFVRAADSDTHGVPVPDRPPAG